MKFLAEEISVLGLCISAFDRLGLEKFIPGYKILTLNDNDWVKHFPELKKRVVGLSTIFPSQNLSKIKTPNALIELDWQKIKENLEVENLLLYKPVDVQQSFQNKNNIKILTNSINLFNLFEDKAKFRETVDSDFFSKYQTLSFNELLNKQYVHFFDNFGKFVIQDSKLSGGRGTFIISNEKEYEIALSYLSEVRSKITVVSKYISGISASLQVCITKNGVFTLPLQRQIINQADLVNDSLSGSDSFNGGQWSQDEFSSEVNILAKKHVLAIAQSMKSFGYKGIFGVDLIVDGINVYIIEVNARLTGMTAIVTQIQNQLNQIPLLLLHTLEHLNIDYNLGSNEIHELENYSLDSSDYGYLVLFNNSEETIQIKNELLPGIYKIENNKLSFENFSYKIDDLEKSNNKFLLVNPPNKGSYIRVNKQICRLVFRRKVVDNNGNLLKEMSNIISQVRKSL